MLRTFTCIMCPRGCEIEAEFEMKGDRPLIGRITGHSCTRGWEYAEQEIVAPMRNIATSILVEGGELPLASVRLTKPVPKARIFDVMAEIRKVKRTAPVLGLGTDVIVTKTVEKE